MIDNKSDLDIREKGYYWVYYGGCWQVMQWCGGNWYKCGGEWGISSESLTKIGNRAVRPDANEATLDIQLVSKRHEQLKTIDEIQDLQNQITKLVCRL